MNSQTLVKLEFATHDRVSRRVIKGDSNDVFIEKNCHQQWQ